MARQNKEPDNYEYLAIVSEWSSTTRQGGVVGNAYPIVNLTLSEIVSEPRQEFPNPGAVFLLSRSQFKTWDFVILRPRRNDQYKDDSDRACYYIPGRTPDIVTSPAQMEKVAVIVNHPTFDIESSARHLLNPLYNVTPYFLVQKNDKYYGPLQCVQRQHSATEEDIQRIDWRAVREDGIVYEFTLGELLRLGLKLFEYRHPDAYLNRVISSPITVAFGEVAKLASNKPCDTLTDAGIIEWYLQRCQGLEIPSSYMTTLKAAFKRPQDDPLIVHTRLRKVERNLAEQAVFSDYRDRIVRNYLDSEAGQKRIHELAEQTIAKKASEIQGEVDQREKELASRRDELTQQLIERQGGTRTEGAESQHGNRTDPPEERGTGESSAGVAGENARGCPGLAVTEA